ncbi:MAG: type II secretion system protein [Ketobacter sp.]|nr:MAG: type II secretion system protein [Ketobacter sp.]
MSLKKQTHTGFTLVEVLVSVALISVVVLYFIQHQLEKVQRDTVEALARDILSITNASVSYYVSTAHNVWPNQEENDCEFLMQTLVDADAFPANYIAMADVTLSFSCVEDDDIGRVLKVTVLFPVGAGENADMLLSYLPTSTRLDDTAEGNPVLVHYVSQPRRAAQSYEFTTVTLTDDGVGGSAPFEVEQPECFKANSQRYMLLPQAVCNRGSLHGLGGFYFEVVDSNANPWIISMKVAESQETNSPVDFVSAPAYCGGSPVEVGVITYCEN